MQGKAKYNKRFKWGASILYLAIRRATHERRAFPGCHLSPICPRTHLLPQTQPRPPIHTDCQNMVSISVTGGRIQVPTARVNETSTLFNRFLRLLTLLILLIISVQCRMCMNPPEISFSLEERRITTLYRNVAGTAGRTHSRMVLEGYSPTSRSHLLNPTSPDPHPLAPFPTIASPAVNEHCCPSYNPVLVPTCPNQSRFNAFDASWLRLRSSFAALRSVALGRCGIDRTIKYRWDWLVSSYSPVTDVHNSSTHSSNFVSPHLRDDIVHRNAHRPG